MNLAIDYNCRKNNIEGHAFKVLDPFPKISL